MGSMDAAVDGSVSSDMFSVRAWVCACMRSCFFSVFVRLFVPVYACVRACFCSCMRACLCFYCTRDITFIVLINYQQLIRAFTIRIQIIHITKKCLSILCNQWDNIQLNTFSWTHMWWRQYHRSFTRLFKQML